MSARTPSHRPTIAIVISACAFATCSRPVTPSEVEGLWRQSRRNAVAAYAEARLEFRTDGTFQFLRMPGEHYGPFLALPHPVDAEGRWTLDERDGDLRVRLQTLTIDGEPGNYVSSMFPRGRGGDVTLSFPLEDPDGAWVWFEKIQFARGELEGQRPGGSRDAAPMLERALAAAPLSLTEPIPCLDPGAPR